MAACTPCSSILSCRTQWNNGLKDARELSGILMGLKTDLYGASKTVKFSDDLMRQIDSSLDYLRQAGAELGDWAYWLQTDLPPELGGLNRMPDFCNSPNLWQRRRDEITTLINAVRQQLEIAKKAGGGSIITPKPGPGSFPLDIGKNAQPIHPETGKPITSVSDWDQFWGKNKTAILVGGGVLVAIIALVLLSKKKGGGEQ